MHKIQLWQLWFVSTSLFFCCCCLRTTWGGCYTVWLHLCIMRMTHKCEWVCVINDVIRKAHSCITKTHLINTLWFSEPFSATLTGSMDPHFPAGCPVWPPLASSPGELWKPCEWRPCSVPQLCELKRLQTGAAVCLSAPKQLGPVISAHWRWHHLTSVHLTHLPLSGFISGPWHMLHLGGASYRKGGLGQEGGVRGGGGGGSWPRALKFSHAAILCQDHVKEEVR